MKQIPSRNAAGVCDVLRPIYFKVFKVFYALKICLLGNFKIWIQAIQLILFVCGKQIPSRNATGVCGVLRPIYFKVFNVFYVLKICLLGDSKILIQAIQLILFVFLKQIPSRIATGVCDVLRPI